MREINRVLDANEKVLWEGNASFLPFFLGRVIFGLLFGIFIFLILVPQYGIGMHVVYLLLALLVVILIPGYTLLTYLNMHFAITDKRVLIQKGIIGRDFQIADHDKITNAEVNVTIIDKLFGGSNTGTILVSTAGSFMKTGKGVRHKPYTLDNVDNPYEVFKTLKSVSHNVKTDINYPNQYRPAENPGYQSSYASKEK